MEHTYAKKYYLLFTLKIPISLAILNYYLLILATLLPTLTARKTRVAINEQTNEHFLIVGKWQSWNVS